MALDIVGPFVGPASVGPNGIPVPGEVLDARYHVNLAWHAREMDPTFAASQVLPDTPSRGWDMAPLPEPGSPPAAPQSIPAWKGKAALREAGLLESVERAVNVAGGRVRDAWDGAVTWALHGWYRHLSWGVLLAAYSPQGRFRQIDAGQHVRAAMAVEQLPAGADGR